MNNAQRDIRRKKWVLEHAARIGNARSPNQFRASPSWTGLPRLLLTCSGRSINDDATIPGASLTLLGKTRVSRGDAESPGFIGLIWPLFNRLPTQLQSVVHCGPGKMRHPSAPPVSRSMTTSRAAARVLSSARDRVRCAPHLSASGSAAA